MNIEKTIFELLGFKFDKEIKLEYYPGVRVCFDGYGAVIGHNSKAALARGYFLLAKEIRAGNTDFDIRQKPAFETCGVLLDMSRGGVMRVSAVKKYLNYMAALGMNMLMLYMEDVYELEGYPLFGYQRGRYTKAELREIDDYADELGIEVIPCIQTLGHMAQYLRWKAVADVRDTPGVLMVGEPKTYELIEAMIKIMRNTFRTNRIHLGMDEAHDMGLGKYLEKNGYHDRYRIFSSHLKRVYGICEKYELKPMIWSDMFFTLDKNRIDYDLDTVVPEEVIREMPDVNLVFWNYFRTDEEYYKVNLQKHRAFGKEVSFAGGVQTWNGFMPNLSHAMVTSKPALKQCIENNVRTVIATVWCDDGCETNHFLALSGLPVFSEYCYLGLDVTDGHIYDTIYALTGMKRDLTEAISDFFLGEISAVRLGKAFFYCDPLYDLIAYDVDYDKAERAWENAIKTIEKYPGVPNYEYYLTLFKIILEKCGLRKNLRAGYLKRDTEYLRKVSEVILPALKKEYARFLEIHRRQWFDTYKAQGFEELNVRYGGVIARIDYAASEIARFLDGETRKIEELETETLTGINRTWGRAKLYMSTYIG